MGWASWNCFRTNINEEKMKKQVDAIIEHGLAECGYEYINMDDGFFGGRDENGVLQINKDRFPNGIKVIADYAHEKGLKAGTYAEGGDKTCGFYYDNEGQNGDNVGLYGHEEQDLKMYLEDWDFDFIKVDWCGGLRLGLNEKEQYIKIGTIIDDIRHRTGKSIVYNICRWQFPGEWATKIADSWRTGADICPVFSSVIQQIDNIKTLSKYCGPGHVNDLDMMQMGNGLSYEEEKTHFAMWCMMSTPLMLGCDLTQINESTLTILKNKELIAVNQDSACLQAYVIKEVFDDHKQLTGEVWIKDLGKKNSNQKAISFLNRSEHSLAMTLDFVDAGLVGEIYTIRDLWGHKDLAITNNVRVVLQPHETIIYKVTSEKSIETIDKYALVEAKAKEVCKITLEEALERFQDGACIVDVRESNEYDEKHIEGAINIPYTGIHATASNYLKDKTRTIIVYCTTGKRSLQAGNSLECLGYQNVLYLECNENFKMYMKL